ncbi:hypothetical protein E2320_001453 [Naja naja]|nr:hypothetical protein E2320_001453 [Naja naja]
MAAASASVTAASSPVSGPGTVVGGSGPGSASSSSSSSSSFSSAGPLSLSRRKDGGPAGKFWESADTASQLEAARAWLVKHYKKYVQADAPTNKTLAGLFQEDAFGKHVANPAFTKFPVCREEGGGTTTCNWFCLSGQVLPGFQSRRDLVLHPWGRLQVQERARVNNCLSRPSIYLIPDIELKVANKLKDIVKRRQPVRSPERRDRKAAAGTRKRKASPSPPPPTPVESRKKVGKKGQASLYGKRRGQKEEEEQDDLTKDMEDPTPVPNVEEVALPKNVNLKKDNEQDDETMTAGAKVSQCSFSLIFFKINN